MVKFLPLSFLCGRPEVEAGVSGGLREESSSSRVTGSDFRPSSRKARKTFTLQLPFCVSYLLSFPTHRFSTSSSLVSSLSGAPLIAAGYMLTSISLAHGVLIFPLSFLLSVVSPQSLCLPCPIRPCLLYVIL